MRILWKEENINVQNVAQHTENQHDAQHSNIIIFTFIVQTIKESTTYTKKDTISSIWITPSTIDCVPFSVILSFISVSNSV